MPAPHALHRVMHAAPGVAHGAPHGGVVPTSAGQSGALAASAVVGTCAASGGEGKREAPSAEEASGAGRVDPEDDGEGAAAASGPPASSPELLAGATSSGGEPHPTIAASATQTAPRAIRNAIGHAPKHGACPAKIVDFWGRSAQRLCHPTHKHALGIRAAISDLVGLCLFHGGRRAGATSPRDGRPCRVDGPGCDQLRPRGRLERAAARSTGRRRGIGGSEEAPSRAPSIDAPVTPNRGRPSRAHPKGRGGGGGDAPGSHDRLQRQLPGGSDRRVRLRPRLLGLLLRW